MKQTLNNALQREMALMPLIIEMESVGIRLDPKILQDQLKYQTELDRLNVYLTKLCNGAEPGKKNWFNIARSKGIIDESKIQYTPKGNPRYGREFLDAMISDQEVKDALSKRSRLQKCLSTYIIPYNVSYKMYNGRVHPWFSQTRGENDYGTRTGRFSSNFQQLPKNNPYPDIPNIREYILPDDGNIIIRRDFSGQELRATAHYAEGNILQAYINEPGLDIHNWVRDKIFELTGIFIEDRVIVKSISFLKLYGGGPTLLATRLGMTVERARYFFKLYDEAIPEFRQLAKDIEALARSGRQIRTWGGRLYSVEPAKYVNGRKQEFYYKLLNILIQGSSADMTKEAMIRYQNNPERKGRLMLTVHDELIASVHPNYVDHEMYVLKDAMDNIPGWDCPLVSDGKTGYNLADMEEYDDSNAK